MHTMHSAHFVVCTLVFYLLDFCESYSKTLIFVQDNDYLFFKYGHLCHPALCSDGSCYCKDKTDGWFNGGAACSKNGRSCGCHCGDDLGTSCQDKRCPDDWSTKPVMKDGYIDGYACYKEDPLQGTVYTNWEFKDFCYKTKEKCDLTRCEFGESLVGCGRAAPGSCEKCTALAAGKYWASKSSCTQNACSLALGGKFIAKPCTDRADAVIANCTSYPGNRGHIVPNSKDTYYCPGGGLVLPLPENSQATPDYSGYVCLPGFYQAGASCLQCTPGSVCKYGRKFECPEHYYSSAFGMSHCTLCTRECGSQWQHPLRCPQGSTANPGCVSCGACDYNPRRGMSCVMEAYEMQSLPVTCTPADVQGSVAVCQT